MLRQTTDLRDRIDRGPKKVKLIQRNELAFEEALAMAKETLQESTLAANSKQLQLGEREATIEKLKANLNTCDSNKEFQLLKDRIAADEQANSVLSDEILELLERIDVLTEKVAEAKSNHAAAVAETKVIAKKIDDEQVVLGAELDQVTKELAEQEKSVPTDLKVDYQRLVKLKGEDALAETDASNCGNCNQRLTTQMAAELLTHKALFCQGCGCLLYPVNNHPAMK
jgi:predicted  nucleic acid-binding Zn-ribbon protein